MKKTILLYGLLMAVLIALLKLLEYRFLVRDFTLEFYIGLLAVFFTALGLWMGLKFRGKSPVSEVRKEESTEELLQEASTFDLSKREFEVLQLIVQGHTNQEIADRLFVSIHTIKTHTSNLYSKLGVKNRTQAIRKAKELHLIH